MATKQEPIKRKEKEESCQVVIELMLMLLLWLNQRFIHWGKGLQHSWVRCCLKYIHLQGNAHCIFGCRQKIKRQPLYCWCWCGGIALITQTLPASSESILLYFYAKKVNVINLDSIESKILWCEHINGQTRMWDNVGAASIGADTHTHTHTQTLSDKYMHNGDMQTLFDHLNQWLSISLFRSIIVYCTCLHPRTQRQTVL